MLYFTIFSSILLVFACAQGQDRLVTGHDDFNLKTQMVSWILHHSSLVLNKSRSEFSHLHSSVVNKICRRCTTGISGCSCFSSLSKVSFRLRIPLLLSHWFRPWLANAMIAMMVTGHSMCAWENQSTNLQEMSASTLASTIQRKTWFKHTMVWHRLN